MNSNRRTLTAAACLALLVSGCATLGGKPEEVVAKRAAERWDALIARDWNRAYGYTAPSFRAAVSAERYVKRFGETVRWLSVDVKSVSCKESDNCAVMLMVRWQPIWKDAKPPVSESRIDETWILEEGRWWFHEKL